MRRALLICGATLVATTFAWLLVLNLSPGDKQIDERTRPATRSTTRRSSGSRAR